MPHELLLKYLSKKRKIDLYNKFMMFAGAIYPLSTVPQIIEIFKGNTAGVSLVSWVIYVIFSVLFITYGYVHRIKLMFMTNILWLIMQSVVVVGLIAR